MEQILQNIHWPTFFLALIVFILISNLTSLVKSYNNRRKALNDLKTVSKNIDDLRAKLRAKDLELENILKNGVKK